LCSESYTLLKDINEICLHYPAFPQTGIKFGTGDAHENVLSYFEFCENHLCESPNAQVGNSLEKQK
jgi:hypothetical protein